MTMCACVLWAFIDDVCTRTHVWSSIDDLCVLFAGESRILFSDWVVKINRRGRTQDRWLIVTGKHGAPEHMYMHVQ